jgi:two-component system OmpR family sensor kinase
MDSGLAIAQRALLAHGGQVRARNRSDGGLEVTLSLPLA